MIGPLIKKAAISLGFVAVTFAGVQLAINAALNAARSAYGEFASVPAAIVSIAGFNAAVGIVLGGVVARLGMMQLKRLQQKVGDITTY
jgi:hypothetical protein